MARRYCGTACANRGSMGTRFNRNSYDHIRNRKLKDALKRIQAQTRTDDILNLAPELELLRALTLVFLEQMTAATEITKDDANAAVYLLDKVGKTAERVHAFQMKAGLVTHGAVVLLTQEMAKELQLMAQDLDGKVFDAHIFMENVKSRWSQLSIDSNAKMLPLRTNEET